MPRKDVWVNSDGLAVGSGYRTNTNNVGTKVSVGGAIQQIQVQITAATLNAAVMLLVPGTGTTVKALA